LPGKGRSKSWWRGYHKLTKKGMSKSSAARIINAAKSKAKRRRK